MTNDYRFSYLPNHNSLSAKYQLILLICESDTADRIPVISTAEHLHTLESLDELID